MASNKIKNIKWLAEMTLISIISYKTKVSSPQAPDLIHRLNIEFQIQAWF